MAVTILLLLGTAAAVTVAGCIRRYPAPTGPAPASMPYSAIATWLRIELPSAPEADEALPDAAFRLAIASGGEVFADAALIDPAGTARIAEDWESALALLGTGSEPVILIATADTIAPSRCAALRELGARVVVAAGTSGFSDDGPDKRPLAGGVSRDPLARAPLDLVCPPDL